MSISVLNSGGQNEAIERNITNKENQKKQLLQRIEDEKKKAPSAAVTEQVRDDLSEKNIKISVNFLVERFGIKSEGNHSKYCEITANISKGKLFIDEKEIQ